MSPEQARRIAQQNPGRFVRWSVFRPECIPGVVPPKGWSFALSFHPATDPTHRVSSWVFSAMLIPEGRGSDLKDWEVLGRTAVAVGAPQNELGDTIQTRPNAVHKWLWRERWWA